MIRSGLSKYVLPAAALFASWPAIGQTTTPITIENVTGITGMTPIGRQVRLNGAGTVSLLGSAAVTFSGTQDETTTFLTQGTFTFYLNRLDSFNVTASPQSISKMTTLSLPGSIAGGTGAFAGASGTVNYTFMYTGTSPSSGTFTLTGAGSLTVGATTTTITLAGFSGAASVAGALNGSLGTTGSVAPFGNATVNFSGMAGGNATAGPIQGELTFVFNASDSFVASFSFTLSLTSQVINLPSIITGGTGAFNGASGSLAATLTLNNDGTYALTGTGTITQPQPRAATITSVTTAFGDPAIAENTFIVIKGANLVPASTPAVGTIWSTAPSFANGLMPTQLGNISVTVNGKPAFVYFFCSAATDPACPQDQLNILTPLDSATGPVQVVVTNAGASTLPFTVNLQPVVPSLLLASPKGYVVATHPDNSLLGPTSLYPGSSTPAKPSETVTLYAVGFGLPATPLVNGSATQGGSLPVLPVCQVGGNPASLTFAGLIVPGLYQLNLTIPSTAPNGDSTLGCSYGGSTTPAGNLITVQR